MTRIAMTNGTALMFQETINTDLRGWKEAMAKDVQDRLGRHYMPPPSGGSLLMPSLPPFPAVQLTSLQATCR